MLSLGEWQREQFCPKRFETWSEKAKLKFQIFFFLSTQREKENAFPAKFLMFLIREKSSNCEKVHKP